MHSSPAHVHITSSVSAIGHGWLINKEIRRLEWRLKVKMTMRRDQLIGLLVGGRSRSESLDMKED